MISFYKPTWFRSEKKLFYENLLETLDFLTNELSKANDVDEILLYMSKAFDLVPHNRLIYKIKEEYGLSENLTNRIKECIIKCVGLKIGKTRRA